MDELNKIMNRLLAEDGCPWDKEQTHETLRPYILEEAQELAEAIDSGNADALKDELGDVLLQVVFHAKLAERAGIFTLDDVVQGLCEKMMRRHTHIFGEDKAATVEDVKRLWQENKRKEKR